MPLDPTIPWQGYNAAQDRKKMAMLERQQATEEKLAQQKLAAEGMDVGKLAERALLKQQMGQQLSPEEDAGLKAWDAMQQTGQTPDMEGNLYPSKRSIYDVLKTKGAPPVAAANPGLPIDESGAVKPRRSLADALSPAAAPGRLSMEDLGIPPMDASELDAKTTNPNSDTIPLPPTGGQSAYRQKESWAKTTDANVDLQKDRAKNQVPGLKTKDGYVPSADDAKQTKEVAAAKQALDSLMDQYDALLAASPNPLAGTPDAQKIEQLQGQMGAQIKALETLGAYDSGVQALMKQMLGDPVIAGGTTVDLAMNPLKAASSTYTKSDPKRAALLNRQRSKQFRDYLNTKLKSTANARGFEPPANKGAVSWEEFFKN